MSKNITKYWCFTLNNPGKEALPGIDHFDYFVYGKEVGDSGTPHLQGFFILKNRQRLSFVKKLFPRAHFERMRGTPLEAATYCKKDGDFKEVGTLPLDKSARLKRRWDDFYLAAKEHRLDDIPSDMLVRYYHAFKRIMQDNPRKLEALPTTCGVWIHGVSGIGKSKMAREDYYPFYDKPLNKWWDGYREEPNVIVDDVDGTHASWIGHFLKRWADHYPFPAEQKGTTMQIRPEKIVVTSQFHLSDLFFGKTLEALERRFKIIHLTKPRNIAEVADETMGPISEEDKDWLILNGLMEKSPENLSG